MRQGLMRSPLLRGVARRLEEQPPGSPYTRGRILAAYAGMMTVVFLAGLDQTIVATALPAITTSLDGLSTYSWVFGSYLLCQTVSIPIFGKLGDVYGRRPLLLIAMVIFLVGSMLCGAAQSMPQLALLRAVQGIGAGGLIPLAMAAVAELVSPRDRGRYNGLITATFVASGVLGPTVGGLLVDHASWRWIFYVNVPFGALALVVVATTMPHVRAQRDRSIDYLGAALLASGTGVVLLALVWGGRTYAWLSTPILAAVAAGAALLGLLVLVERRAAEPILPFELLRIPAVAAGAVCWSMSVMCMFGALAFVPLFMQGVIGATATSSGFVLMPMMLGIVVANVVSGQLIARTGHYRGHALFGPVALGVGMTLLWRMDLAATSREVAVNMVVCGVGIGAMNQVFLVSALNVVPNRVLGTATAILQFGRALGTTLGVTLFGLIVNQQLPEAWQGGGLGVRPSERERQQLDDALDPAFLFGVALCVAIFVVAYRLIGGEPLRTTVDDAPAPVDALAPESVPIARRT
jgi:EmrB/QacA subfamily drug resistance transporter